MSRVVWLVWTIAAATLLSAGVAGCSANLRFDVDQPASAKQQAPAAPTQPGWTPPDRYRG